MNNETYSVMSNETATLCLFIMAFSCITICLCMIVIGFKREYYKEPINKRLQAKVRRLLFTLGDCMLIAFFTAIFVVMLLRTLPIGGAV